MTVEILGEPVQIHELVAAPKHPSQGMPVHDFAGAFLEIDAIGSNQAHIGMALDEPINNFQIVWIDHVVWIEEGKPLTVRVVDSKISGRRLTAIFFVEHGHQYLRSSSPLLEQGQRIIRGTVVDDDYFDAIERECLRVYRREVIG